MIRALALKEFRLNVRLMRFGLALLLCLLIVPFTMVVGIDTYRQRVALCTREADEGRRAFESSIVWSKARPVVVRSPEAVELFCWGLNGSVGYANRIELGQVPGLPGGEGDDGKSPFLETFATLDFAGVLGIVVSLLALLFSYDAFTREREEGTLRMLFSFPVGRWAFVGGKLAGIVLTVAPILLFCYLLALGLVCGWGGIRLSASDWAGVGCMLLLTLVYLLLFVALGLLVSAVVMRLMRSVAYGSATAILLCMQCWACCLFVVPPLATYLAELRAPLPDYPAMQERIRAARSSFDRGKDQQWKHLNDSMALSECFPAVYIRDGEDGGVDLRGGSVSVLAYHRHMAVWEARALQALAAERWQTESRLLQAQYRQRRWKEALDVSPSSLFLLGMSRICYTDVGAVRAYMEAVRAYRERFIAYLEERNLFADVSYISPEPETEYMEHTEWVRFMKGFRELRSTDLAESDRTIADLSKRYMEKSYPALDVGDVPRFAYPVPDGGARFRRFLPVGGGMAVAAAVLFVCTVVIFRKQEI